MKKVKSIKHNKIWGYEIWMYSSVLGMETTFEDGTKNEEGPLIKIIKADKPLSVQVHPDDKLAKELENQPNGKSESWYVIDHEPGAELVMGLKTYNENEIRTKLKNKTFKDSLNTIPVTKGSFYDIPAGLVHGIGAGMTIFEVQQPSDTTYRYYDYDRLQDGMPRELHIDKAIKCQKELNWNLDPIAENPKTYKNIVGKQTFMASPTTLEERSIIIDLENFEAYVAECCEKINFTNYVIVSFK